MKRKLGRKGEKIRNKLIILLIFFITLISIYIVINRKNTQIDNGQYKEGIRQLAEATKNIENNQNGTTYYISEQGTSQEGTDKNDPMSLKTAKTKIYKDDDKILFRAGNTFYDTISFNIQTSENKYVYIGAYGDGDKPIISGAKILSNEEKIEKIKEYDDIYKIDLSNKDNFSGIDITTEASCNVGFILDKKGNIYGNRKESIELLKENMDFYCDSTNIYIKCDENPIKKLGTLKIGTNVALYKASSNTVVDGLEFEVTGGHAIIKRDYPIKNVYIKNCLIENIGGSVQILDSFTRYGNAIEFWLGAENILIENNIIKNAYDAAITLQGDSGSFNNIDINNNILISNCYSFELWATGKSTGMSNVNIYNNITINQGKCWGQSVRPNPYNSAEFVFYSYAQNAKMNININNNTYYNPTRLYYVLYSIKDRLKKETKIDNNIFRVKDEIYVVNDNKSDKIKDYLNQEYNQDQNSTFKLLTDKQIEQISNTEILNSNDYNKIKKYYENLEKEFSYDEIKQPIIDNYNKYINENTITLSKITNATNDLNDIKNRIESTQLNTLNENILKEITDDIYTIEVNTLKANVEGKITNKEMEQTIKNLNELAHQIDNIYNKAEISNQFNKKDIEKYIEQAQERIDNCQDLNIENLSLLLNIGNDILSEETTTYADYLYVTMLDTWSKSIIDKKIEQYINENPVQIEYSEQKLTNKNVIATIKTNANIKILNNSNKRDYIFKENGVFTFEYEIKERKLSIQAKVTNIDKTPPQITGIEQDGKYKESITPQITDENLSEVKLIKDGQEVENYKQNTAITQEGIYQLKATDKAGNETSINFVIAYPEDEKYKIENNTIKNIKGETSVETLKGKLQVDEKYTIKRKNTEIQNSENIATGDILETESGNKYTLIVRGDLNKDGKVDIKDLVKMRKFLLLGNNLEESEEMAADTNIDGKEISIKDLVKMRIILLTQ